MDTLTHALSGALLARVIAARQAPFAAQVLAVPGHGRLAAPWDRQPGAPAVWQCVLTGFLAGAFPDIDAVVQSFGDLAYLRHHRGVTHSVLLLPLWAVLVAWLMSKCFAATRGQRGGWKSLWLVSAAAIGIHIAGDWITAFGTMLLEPLSSHRFGLGSVFIIDLVLSGTLIAGLLLAAIWPHRRWPALAGLAAACAWVGVTWVGQQEALEVGRTQARALGIADAEVQVMPRPASPFNWTVAVSDGRRWHLAHVNTRRSEPLVADADDHFVRRFSAPYLPVAMAEWQVLPQHAAEDSPPWVQEAWQHEGFGFFRWFAEAPALIRAEERRNGNGERERCAFWRDLRFEWPGRESGPFRYGLCLADDGSARPYRLDDEVARAL
ncbi:MAG: metal-dependent hydrolase [Rubrivivax sp.]|nr:metal-dependent hydrolase [Rubrivivax sp.]